MNLIAILSIVSAAVSLLALLILHFTNPEYKPSWRMVSEYAYGTNKWLITLFFFGWGLSTLLLGLLLLNSVSGTWALIGVMLVFISGIGAIMGGLFDVKHKLHGLSFMLGVPTFIIGTLLIGYHLSHTPVWQLHASKILLFSHAVWISCVLMGVSMGLMFSGFKKAGISWEKDAEPPTEVPEGVIAVGGYANRLLILCYVGWNVLMAFIYLKSF